ncbi:DUF3592 domain-containing protein [Actinomadura bangladeshensis]|uniref:DUF3592 domain-containing protein n=1 Tax=Actinomadura bangladeshensis TaxID=453573 RepID=A0A4R4NTS9_9ACTN|nr:DUF3592 domain-containing protein [Actinomadura bangladeshensis]TDC12394.1 DUF3592 domain-containing protein [Actinomadura bangladeshensis]
MSSWLLVVVPLLLGPAAAVGGVHRFRAGRRFLASAHRVPGIVVGSHRVRSLDTYEYFPVLRYRTLDGVDIETVGKTASGSYELFRLKGHLVDVLYDPREPREARMDTSSGRGLAGSIGLAALGCVFTAIGLVLLYTRVT